MNGGRTARRAIPTIRAFKWRWFVFNMQPREAEWRSQDDRSILDRSVRNCFADATDELAIQYASLSKW